MELQISNIDLKWVGEIDESIPDIWTGNQIIKKVIVCRFDYYKDMYNQIWANKICTNVKFQEKGYGTLMIQKALKEYGIIYFSNAPQLNFKILSNDNQNDFRYTTDNFEDSNLGKFTNRLISKNIIDASWVKNPFV